jgi:putative peptidoglycan lipid II flippase
MEQEKTTTYCMSSSTTTPPFTAGSTSSQEEESYHKSSIIKKTIQVGSSTLLSRLLGLVREILMVNFLGAGALSDAFVTAYKIPNSLRKIFAEGALSAAFIPTLIAVSKKKGRHDVNSLMTLTFLVFEGILLGLCTIIFIYADAVVKLIAPGWFLSNTTIAISDSASSLTHLMAWIAPAWYSTTCIPQAEHAIVFVKILIPFIIFISSSALLAGALQTVNHFFVPALCTVLFNVVFITGILTCLWLGLSVNALCYFILLGGFLQFLLHLATYIKFNFNFAHINRSAGHYFKQVVFKFIPCLFSMSINEINLFVSTSFASYLPQGSISLIYYANRFMGIPLGVFSTAFSTILLPYFSRIHIDAPHRLGFYLYESAKVIFWVTISSSLIMIFLSEKVFHTIFLSKKFSLDQVAEAHYILIAFLGGLFFFSLNKIMLNMYYSRQNTLVPTLISLLSAACNYYMSRSLLAHLGATGLALAVVGAGILQSVLLALFLYRLPHFTFHLKEFVQFALRAFMQIGLIFISFVVIYKAITLGITTACTPPVANFLLYKIGFWFWVGPLCLAVGCALIKTRKFFGIHLYFLD